jgi:hypothetical protein
MTETTTPPAPPPFPDSFRALMRLVDEMGGEAINAPRAADQIRKHHAHAAEKALQFDYYSRDVDGSAAEWREEAKVLVRAMAHEAGEVHAAVRLSEGAGACRTIIRQLPGMVANALTDLQGYAVRLDQMAKEAETNARS